MLDLNAGQRLITEEEGGYYPDQKTAEHEMFTLFKASANSFLRLKTLLSRLPLFLREALAASSITLLEETRQAPPKLRSLPGGRAYLEVNTFAVGIQLRALALLSLLLEEKKPCIVDKAGLGTIMKEKLRSFSSEAVLEF